MARKRRVEVGQPLTPTASGRFCPECGRARADCRCRRKGKAPAPARVAPPGPDDGVVRVGRQTKGRKGKGVTVVTGVPLAGPELERLARELKQRCGSGGTVRDGVIEIQGDHRGTLTIELGARGWQVKQAGG
ncbi:MAG: SUI1 family translation initiation factor [Planctomycetota bacterium]|jgi:translation initiation factor 1